MVRRCAVLVALASVIVGIAGCSGSAPPLTKDEQKDFKGGPMPESARKIMQEKMEAAKGAVPQGGQPNGEVPPPRT